MHLELSQCVQAATKKPGPLRATAYPSQFQIARFGRTGCPILPFINCFEQAAEASINATLAVHKAVRLQTDIGLTEQDASGLADNLTLIIADYEKDLIDHAGVYFFPPQLGNWVRRPKGSGTPQSPNTESRDATQQGDSQELLKTGRQ